MPELPAFFVADSRGLDFLNSVTRPTEAVVDWLENGAGLLTWLEQAELVPSDVVETFRARGRSSELDRIAKQARELREWFRAFVRKHMGRPLPANVLRELEPLSRLLERDQAYTQLMRSEDGERRLELRKVRRWSSAELLLLPIAEALAQLIADDDFSDVKACEGHACSFVFADHTRGRARRWCTMSVCGNRAKQAAHRQRLKDEG